MFKRRKKRKLWAEFQWQWQLNFNGSHCAVAFNNSRKQLFIYLFISIYFLFPYIHIFFYLSFFLSFSLSVFLSRSGVLMDAACFVVHSIIFP